MIMNILKILNEHRSWLMSAGIALLIVIWLSSGQLRGDTEAPSASNLLAESRPVRSSVRVRSQSAEEIMRTVVVNGKTAPARVVELAAETDGRVEFVGARRGAQHRSP